MESLQAEITRDGSEWPANFFEPPPEEDLAVVREAVDELEQHTRTHRRNRGAAVAISHGASLVTANLVHFSRITGLDVRHW